MQILEPDLKEWCIEASDLISRPRTFLADEGDFVVQDNKIQLCPEMQMIDCASINCTPLSFKNTRGCTNLTGSSRCRGSNCVNFQQFTLDSCYMHFTPKVNDGVVVHIEYLKRPIGPDGYPLIMDVCSMAISEYVAAYTCMRFGDKQGHAIWYDKWEKHVRNARVELNRLFQQDQVNIGMLYFAVNGAWGSRQFGLPYAA